MHDLLAFAYNTYRLRDRPIVIAELVRSEIAVLLASECIAEIVSGKRTNIVFDMEPDAALIARMKPHITEVPIDTQGLPFHAGVLFGSRLGDSAVAWAA